MNQQKKKKKKKKKFQILAYAHAWNQNNVQFSTEAGSKLS